MEFYAYFKMNFMQKQNYTQICASRMKLTD